jgi:hypothetical protein
MIARRSLPAALALAVVAVFLPFTQGEALADHGARRLEVTPEVVQKEINQTQTLVAHLVNDDGEPFPANVASGAINIDFEMETGSNDPDGATSNSPTTPDRTCSIPAGQSQCDVEYFGDEPGDDQWRIWIDHDGENSTVEADAGVMGEGGEGRYAGPTDSDEQVPEDDPIPGVGDQCRAVQGVPSGQEPDCTDVIRIEWSGIVFPGFIDCDDEQGPDTERALNPSGGGAASNERVACFVFDQNGNPINDADPTTTARDSTTMYGENQGGPNDPDDGSSYATDDADYRCSTPTSGSGPFNRCFMDVTQGELEEGSAEICFWARGEFDSSVGEAGLTHCETEGEPTGENQRSTGADGPNDLADQTQVAWAERALASLDVENESTTHVLGENRQLVATVYDQFGDPFQGSTEIKFEFFSGSPTDRTDASADGNSPASADESCTTVNSSTCTETYSQSTVAGRDLICAWIGNAPGMSLNNRNDRGVCLGEKRNDGDDAADEADAPAPANDRRDVVSTVWTNDPPATVLECTPESTGKLSRSRHTIRCRATTGQPDSGVPNTEIDIEATGANDRDGGNSRGTPDFRCVTDTNGFCSVSHGGGRGTRRAGVTTYTAWIDTNYHDNIAESDNGEKRNETKTPGGTEEPDTTDVVQNRWISGGRDLSLRASDNNVSRGSRVDLTGKINAAAGRRCEDNELVQLQKKSPGDRRFRNMKNRTDNAGNSGGFSFKNVRVFGDTVFRAVAKYSGGCMKANSNAVTVNT